MSNVSSVSSNVISSMFNHLMQSYSEEEARFLLIQKYPDSADVISQINPDEYRRTVVEMGSAVKVIDAVEPQEPKQAKAVKGRKPSQKATSAPKKETKADVARRLYSEATDKSRGAIIQLFIDNLGMSKAAASTYFYNVKGQ